MGKDESSWKVELYFSQICKLIIYTFLEALRTWHVSFWGTPKVRNVEGQYFLGKIKSLLPQLYIHPPNFYYMLLQWKRKQTYYIRSLFSFLIFGVVDCEYSISNGRGILNLYWIWLFVCWISWSNKYFLYLCHFTYNLSFVIYNT